MTFGDAREEEPPQRSGGNKLTQEEGEIARKLEITRKEEQEAQEILERGMRTSGLSAQGYSQEEPSSIPKIRAQEAEVARQNQRASERKVREEEAGC